jgi:hypothetical protein
LRRLPLPFNEDTGVKRVFLFAVAVLISLSMGCNQPHAKSAKTFDDISNLVKGKTAAEVEKLLGRPDSRDPMVMSGERWTWWNYTVLGGSNYPPEERGRVVHLEIIFEPEVARGNPATASTPVLRVMDPLGVSYTIPQITK